eukprot:scaffold2499_cov125-Cylindrotheca_fusiformis.AAC.4
MYEKTAFHLIVQQGEGYGSDRFVPFDSNILSKDFLCPLLDETELLTNPVQFSRWYFFSRLGSGTADSLTRQGEGYGSDRAVPFDSNTLKKCVL